MSTENEEVMQEPAETLVPATPEGLAMLKMILEQQSTSARESMLEAIREMKRPSEEEQEKIDKERKQSMDLTMRRVASAKRAEANQEERWARCSHRQPNGKTRFRGQINSNGYGQAFCSECQMPSGQFKAYPHELMGGLNITEWNGDVLGILKQRVLNSPPPDAIPDIPAGARIIFD